MAFVLASIGTIGRSRMPDTSASRHHRATGSKELLSKTSQTVLSEQGIEQVLSLRTA